MLKDHKHLVEKTKLARVSESKRDIEPAFGLWCEVSRLIDEFEEKYFDSAKIKWAERQPFFHFNANFWIGVLAEIISGVIVTVLFDVVL